MSDDRTPLEVMPKCSVDCRVFCKLSTWGVCDRSFFRRATPLEIAGWRVAYARSLADTLRNALEEK